MIRILLNIRLGERRMAQSDLAKKTGIRPATINSMYHDFADRVSLHDLDKICHVLNCDLSELLRRDGQDPFEETPRRGVKVKRLRKD